MSRREVQVVGPGNRPPLRDINGQVGLARRLVIDVGEADVVPDRRPVALRHAHVVLRLLAVDVDHRPFGERKTLLIEVVRIEVSDMIHRHVERRQPTDRLARHRAAEAVGDEVVGERIVPARRRAGEAEINHRGEEGIGRGARPPSGRVV